MDDVKAAITASIIATNGQTNTVQGLMERSGAVWFNNLPLNSGTNIVTVTATDAAGNMSATSFNVVGNDVGLVVDPLTDDQMNQTSVTVTGSIGDPVGDCVWVNDVQAGVDPDTGDWEADGVPVNPTGTATLAVRVYVGDPVLISSKNIYKPQPALVALQSYMRREYQNDTSYYYQYTYSGASDSVINWDYAGGGTDHEWGFSYFCSGCGDNSSENNTYSLSAGEGAYSVAWENANGTFTGNDGGDGTITTEKNIQTRVMIVPPGQQAIGQSELYLVMAQVLDVDTGLQLAAGAVRFVNQLAGTATEDVTNSDSSVWSQGLVSGAAGTQLEVTPMAAGNYSFSQMGISPSKLVYFSVEPPPGSITTDFNAYAVQTNLQTQLAGNVFDSLPAGKGVKIGVHVDATWGGTLGWDNQKHFYVNRVTWNLQTSDESYNDGKGDVLLNADNIFSSCGTANPDSRTFANIFAHEGIWGNASGNHVDDANVPFGDIAHGGANAFLPYTVAPSSRTAIRSGFGF